MKVSVVIATYNRQHLLRRALESYVHQSFPREDFELVYIDDWSADGTDELLREYATKLNIVSIRPTYKKPGHWRSEASVINLGIRAAKGELVIATHPEIMPGTESLSALWDARLVDAYLCCKVYFLTHANTQELDSVPWRESRQHVRELNGFYTDFVHIEGGGETYWPQNIESANTFESWVFGGFSRKKWQWLGGFAEFEQWGSIDIDFLNRRSILGIHNHTLKGPETYCLHQNHDYTTPENPWFTPIVRSSELALNGLPVYTSADQARLHNL